MEGNEWGGGGGFVCKTNQPPTHVSTIARVNGRRMLERCSEPRSLAIRVGCNYVRASVRTRALTNTKSWKLLLSCHHHHHRRRHNPDRPQIRYRDHLHHHYHSNAHDIHISAAASRARPQTNRLTANQRKNSGAGDLLCMQI